MTNKFKIGEIVIINGKGKIYEKQTKALGIIEAKDYYYNEYLVSIFSNKKQDWFSEEDIYRVLEKTIKKTEKYKVVLAIDKKGLDIIYQKFSNIPDKNNNLLNKVDFYKEYKINRKKYALLVWTSTYWPENNFIVKIIEDNLTEFRAKNIAYKQIIIGETDPTFIKINEFISNDKNVDIFNILHKIEIKNIGGILV